MQELKDSNADNFVAGALEAEKLPSDEDAMKLLHNKVVIGIRGLVKKKFCRTHVEALRRVISTVLFAMDICGGENVEFTAANFFSTAEEGRVPWLTVVDHEAEARTDAAREARYAKAMERTAATLKAKAIKQQVAPDEKAAKALSSSKEEKKKAADEKAAARDAAKQKRDEKKTAEAAQVRENELTEATPPRLFRQAGQDRKVPEPALDGHERQQQAQGVRPLPQQD
jgi:hypothetical protein